MIKKIVIILMLLFCVIASGTEIILPKELGDTGMVNGQYLITDTDGSHIIGTYPLRPEPNLYGDEENPHVFYFYANHVGGIDNDRTWFNSHIEDLKEAKVGVVCLFGGCYTAGHQPIIVNVFGHRFYKYEQAEVARQFIREIHDAGMKAITYIYTPTHAYWERQDYRTTLNLMDEFGKEYKLDGWYIDGGKFGTQVETLVAFKHLAIMYEVIVLHDSCSLIDGEWPDAGREEYYPYGIIPSVHVRNYVTHTLCNEVLPEFQPKDATDPLWDTYISDEKVGNTIRSINWADRSPMSEIDICRTAAQKKITIQFKRSNYLNPAWQAYWTEYEKMQEAYEAGRVE